MHSIKSKNLGDEKTARFVFNKKMSDPNFIPTEEDKLKYQSFVDIMADSLEKGGKNVTKLAIINLIGAIYDVVKIDRDKQLFLIKTNADACKFLKIRAEWLATSIKEYNEINQKLFDKYGTKAVLAGWDYKGNLVSLEAQIYEKIIEKEVTKKVTEQVFIEKNESGTIKFEKIEKYFRHKEKNLNEFTKNIIKNFLDEIKKEFVK